MKTQTNCPASQLSGFPPAQTTVQSWMEKLKENGITEGCLCRLVHGRDEDKIVKFENYHVNDLGVCIDGGYFLFQDGDTLKVAQPLFVPLLELSDDVMFFGIVEENFKSACFGGSRSFIEINQNCKLVDNFYDEMEFFLDNDDPSTQIFQFRTARDLFAWMAFND